MVFPNDQANSPRRTVLGWPLPIEKKKKRGSVGRGGRISLGWGLGVTPWPGDTDPRWP